MARWYDLTPEEAAEQLDSDLSMGLSPSEAKKRLKDKGRNAIFPLPQGNFIGYLKKITFNPLSLLLLLTSVLTAIFQDALTSLIAILLLGAGYVTAIFVYVKAQNVLAGMSRFSLPYARVLRGGRMYIVRQEQLVPGDIIFLSAGDIVPADARLIEDQALYLLESGITDAKGSVRKNAYFYDYRNLAPHEQINMVFASTIVAKGRGKAVICRCGADALVCQSGKKRPAARYDKLALFDRLKKVSHYISVASIGALFLLTFFDLMTKRLEILTCFVLLLSLFVSVLSEFYTAFARILVAGGIFGAMEQKDGVTRGALIKNADKLTALQSASVLIIPPESLISEQDMKLDKLYAGGRLMDAEEDKQYPLCMGLMRYALLSTGIYGAGHLLSLNLTGENVFTFEEDAILKAGRNMGVWNAALDNEWALVDHQKKGDLPYDITITRHSGQYILIVRGDVRQILDLCSHSTDQSGQPKPLSVVRRQQILTTAGQIMRQSHHVAALASTLTADCRIASLGDLTGQLTFEGLIAFDQPLLPGSAMTVNRCKEAGIKLILFCPEESEKNYYLAQTLGILEDRSQAVSSSEIDNMGEALFLTNFPNYRLYQGLSLSRRKKILHLLKERGETVLYMGRELPEISMIREADVGLTQALALSGKIRRRGMDPSGVKLPISISKSSDGAPNGCDALRFVSDVVVSMVSRDGSGGLNALVGAICRAKTIFRNLQRMFSYLAATFTIRTLAVLFSLVIGMPLLTSVQVLFLGFIVDLSAVLILAFEKPPRQILKLPAQAPRSITESFRSLLRPALTGAFFFVVQAVSVLILRFAKLSAAQYACCFFISAIPASLVLLWESGRTSSQPKKREWTMGNMPLTVLLFLIIFLLIAFLIPAFGAPFGIVRLPYAAWIALLAPSLLLIAFCELMRKLFGHPL